MGIEEGFGDSSDEPILIFVKRDLVPALWPVLMPFLEFLENDRPQLYTMESLLEALLDGRMQLWAVGMDNNYTAAGITQIIEFPANKVLEVVGCGGVGIDRWLKLMDSMKAWAKLQGCTAVRVIGRRGWMKLLKAYNYNGDKVIVSAEITP